MKTGVNTYGLSRLLKDDFEGTLRALRDMGYQALEPLILFAEKEDAVRSIFRQYGLDDSFLWSGEDARQKIEKARAMGFAVESIHPTLNSRLGINLTATLPDMITFARDMELRYCVYSPQVGKIMDIYPELHMIRAAAAMLKEHGISLLAHNHAVELQNDGDDTVLDHILREIPELGLEFDVGWAVYAGADVLNIMRRYYDRIPILHFKDILGTIRDGKEQIVAVGKGMIPLDDILKEAQHLPLADIGFIVDQDSSMGDMLEDLRTSIRNIRTKE